MRFGSALSLARDLRAAVVPRTEIERAVARLASRMRRFTPHVEPSVEEPGVFWLDAKGLERLHDSLRSWATLVRSDLEAAGFRATVVVGFGRFGSYALARAKRGVLVLRNRTDERAAARRVPLERLAVEPATRDALHKLGIGTVGQLVDLPVGGVSKRFGPELLRLHRLATGDLRVPLQPERPEPPAMRRVVLGHAETNVERLIHAIEEPVHTLLDVVGKRGRALSELRIGFRFERMGDHIEKIRPASATLNAKRLIELVRLRLRAVRKLPDGVEEVVLFARETEATRRQSQLLARKKRDLEAANRGLARVRAQLGDGAVVRARLREGHLPEGSFTWEGVDALEEARPRNVAVGRLVRRIHARPVPLPPRPRQEPDGWMLRGLDQGPVVRVMGPYVVSGGWWNRTVHREYHFAETRTGELLWVFYDRPRRRWYLHGRVE
jgi:protein ImuB